MVLMPNTPKGGGISRKILIHLIAKKLGIFLIVLNYLKVWVLLLERREQIKAKMR